MSDKEIYSYGMGISIGANIKNQDIDLDFTSFAEALKTVLDGGKLKYNNEEIEAAIALETGPWMLGQPRSLCLRFHRRGQRRP